MLPISNSIRFFSRFVFEFNMLEYYTYRVAANAHCVWMIWCNHDKCIFFRCSFSCQFNCFRKLNGFIQSACSLTIMMTMINTSTYIITIKITLQNNIIDIHTFFHILQHHFLFYILLFYVFCVNFRIKKIPFCWKLWAKNK